MFSFLMCFFDKKHSYNNSQPFNKDFRKGYKNAWINNIKDYIP